jgi:hypothetical protein
MLRYIYISTLSLLLCSFHLLAQTDTGAVEVKKPKENVGHQLCIGVDLFQPFMNSLVNYRTGYEMTADYYFKNDIYFVAEGGFGGADINYNNLVYKSTNNFFRVGINKSLFARMKPDDWDMAFIGLRYGMAFIQRSAATYTVIDTTFGSISGTVPAATITGYWMEITGGMRVELVKGLCAGYTIRGKFRLNDNAFKELAPAYVAGYGRGDKNSVFDFNLYISYAIRWRKQH